MARRGSSKDRSVRQEEDIARWYGGRRSPSSGASMSDLGDVRTDTHLFECKVRGEFDPDKDPPKSISISMADWTKITDEALEAGRYPVMALRIYQPDHVLADRDGWLDLIVRHVHDDLDGRS